MFSISASAALEKLNELSIDGRSHHSRNGIDRAIPLPSKSSANSYSGWFPDTAGGEEGKADPHAGWLRSSPTSPRTAGAPVACSGRPIALTSKSAVSRAPSKTLWRPSCRRPGRGG